jgi:hypothetical protein
MVAVVAAVGVGVAVGASRGVSHQRSSPASPSAIEAFLARAQRAFSNRYSVTYAVNGSVDGGKAERAQVVAAQFSSYGLMYRVTPRPGSASHVEISEVFEDPRNDPHGFFACTRRRGRSRWTCIGPYDEGMTDLRSLFEPDAPLALLEGLQNATAAYAGPLATSAAHAFLTRRRVGGHPARCVELGRVIHPLGSVCLDGEGVIVWYEIPRTVSLITYSTAKLTAYSRRVQTGTLSLPTRARPPAQLERALR